MNHRFIGLFLCGSLWAMAFLASCAVTNHSIPIQPLDKSAQWVLLPFVNNTETPLAGSRAEAIAEPLLRGHGVNNLTKYPASITQEGLFEGSNSRIADEAISWARQQNARYAVTGAVSEWRYKVGVDGEPAVGITLQLVDVPSGQVVWSGVGGKSGWARESLAAVAQKLVNDVLSPAFKAAK